MTAFVDEEVRPHGPDDIKEVDLLRNALTDARQDLRTVAAMLLEEAQTREWCDEYDRFVRKVNQRVGRTVLRGCERENAVRLDVRFTWQGESHEPIEHRPGIIDAMHRAITHMVETEQNLPADMNWSVD